MTYCDTIHGILGCEKPHEQIQSDLSDLLELIGAVDDVPFSESIFGNLNAIYKHVHSPAMCYPTLAAGKTINGGAGAWQLGTVTELIPANTITVPFDIH